MSKESAVKFGVSGEALIGDKVFAVSMPHFEKIGMRGFDVLVVDTAVGIAIQANVYDKMGGEGPFLGAGYDKTKYQMTWPLSDKGKKKAAAKGRRELTEEEVRDLLGGTVLLRGKVEIEV